MRTIALLALIGCKTTAADVDPIEIDRYDPNHLMVVEATLTEDNWDGLRQESRSFVDLVLGPECFTEPVPQVFNWYPGDVRIDGEPLSEVGFRKKGLIGSMSWTRPSLKIDSDRFVDGQEFIDDTEHFTLNNNNQDVSRVHTCLAYAVFERAGAIAPRCSFATVEVNEVDLGVYSNVEPIKKAFLRDRFGTDEGDLYEGTASDVTDEWLATYDIKSDGSTLAPLEELRDVLDLPDGELMAALDEVLDVDAFITEWAVESLIGHWDGYAQGRNNYYIHHHPDDGLLTFIPWGPDATFQERGPEGLFVASALTMRLYNHPEGHALYMAESERLLADVWDEEWLHAQVDQYEDLIVTHLLDDIATLGEIDRVHDFIDGRRAVVQTVIDTAPERPSYDVPRTCIDPVGEVSATFSTRWGTMDQEPFNFPGTLSGSVFGVPMNNHYVGAQAGLNAQGNPELVILGVNEALDTASGVVVQLSDDLEPGSYPLDIAALSAFAFTIDLTAQEPAPQDIVLLGGDLLLGQISYWQNGPISGELDAILIPNPFG
ncbi:MAG: CotH kinase family protein [Proteobacteria bacterium]|nr:CotH kinase family protein [Pseudomonadota bacterium]